MGSYDLHFLAHQERYKDLLREAAQERLFRDAQHQQPDHGKWYQPVLFWVGVHLMQWGYKLQQRGTTTLRCFVLPQQTCVADFVAEKSVNGSLNAISQVMLYETFQKRPMNYTPVVLRARVQEHAGPKFCCCDNMMALL